MCSAVNLYHISELLIHSTKLRFLKHCFSNLYFVFRRSLKIIKPHLKQSSSNRIDFESCFALVKRKIFSTKKKTRAFCYQYPPKHLHNNSEECISIFLKQTMKWNCNGINWKAYTDSSYQFIYY